MGGGSVHVARSAGALARATCLPGCRPDSSRIGPPAKGPEIHAYPALPAAPGGNPEPGGGAYPPPVAIPTAL